MGHWGILEASPIATSVGKAYGSSDNAAGPSGRVERTNYNGVRIDKETLWGPGRIEERGY